MKTKAPKYKAEYRLRFADGQEVRLRLGGLQVAILTQLMSVLRVDDIKKYP